MNDEELRARLVDLPKDAVILTSDVTPSVNPIISSAEKVMESYQNANKWLDSIKEYVLMELGCLFFSDYIHKLAHTMPVRFDKFGDILHTADIVVPYPATSAIANMPTDIPSTIDQIYSIVSAIRNSLLEFIKATQDTEGHALACSAEELLIDISKEYTNLYRMNRAYNNCNSSIIDFDKWVLEYLKYLDTLID